MARIGANNRIEGGILFEREAVVDLPTGQVRALNGTARALVPAPGTGLALVPLSLTATMLGATAFGGISTSENIILRYEGTTAARATLEPTGFLDQTDTPSRVVSCVSEAAAYEPEPDTALELSNSGAITGGSPVRFTLTYHVIKV